MYRRKRSWWGSIGLFALLSLLAILIGSGCALLTGRPETQPAIQTAPQPAQAAGAQPSEIPPDTKPPEPEEPWNLILVNPWNPLPEDFVVELAEAGNGHMVDSRILPELEEMLAQANSLGLYPVICSSYRSMETQEALYANRIQRCLNDGLAQEEATAEAGKWVAVPGTSEHQTGLALDIVSADYGVLDWAQEDTAEQKWLMENSWKYGFILRYPTEKTELTGIYYEPWHYRYVGKEAAAQIHVSGLCLEEYLLGPEHGAAVPPDNGEPLSGQ